MSPSLYRLYHCSRWANAFRLRKLMAQTIPSVSVPPSTESCLADAVLEAGIKRSLFTTVGGVFVVHAPPDSATKAAARRAIQGLQDSHEIGGALYLDPQRWKKEDTLISWVKRECCITCQIRSVDDLLPEAVDVSKVVVRHFSPVVMLIDPLHRTMNVDTWKCNIVTLAQQSTMRKKFIVLLLVEDDELANEALSWNGGEKIQKVMFQ